ncbi:MAG: amidohydrolase [Alphaproteobacteria bacterium]
MDQMLFDTLRAWRRHLHAHPELSQCEHRTAAFVRERLDGLAIPYAAGVGGEGIVATLRRGGGDRSVGLRADLDALPIQELGAIPYASTHAGVMHACGHDGHTVALLGAAATLAQDPSWEGTIQLVFQPAEENGAGAKAMIADGLFDRFPMERIFAFHNWPGMPAGTVAVHDGAVMAAGGRWTITLHGRAGHAAKPHLTRDPIVAAGHLIVALQSIVAREVPAYESVVLSIGSIQGGTVSNQIPGSVTLVGTLRTYDTAVRGMVIEAMTRIAQGIAATFGLRAETDITSTGRPTVNTPAEAALAVAAAEIAGLAVRRDLPPSGGGDDFAFLLARRPGAYVWIGNGEAGPEAELHAGHYDFNDDILPAAVGWMSTVARLALAAPREL